MSLKLMLALAAVTQEPTFKSAFDQPISELRGDKPEGVLDRLSLNQMMRFTALPDSRLREFQCAGVVNWDGSKSWPAFAMTDVQRHEFVTRVIDAVANDVELDREIAAHLIDAYSMEPPHREQKGELPAWRAEMEGNCADLIAKVRTGNYQLAPLAKPSVVNSTLATCYARYTIAAEARKDEEAASMQKTAARAETLALHGKQGDALIAAKAALADGLAAARAESISPEGDVMMRLVMCLPAMDAAEKELGAK